MLEKLEMHGWNLPDIEKIFFETTLCTPILAYINQVLHTGIASTLLKGRLNMFKNKLYIIATIIFSVLFIFVGGKIASSNMPNIEHIYQDDCSAAKVVGIISRQSAAQEIEGIIFGDGINNGTFVC